MSPDETGKGTAPPRRNPFRQEIISKDELERLKEKRENEAEERAHKEAGSTSESAGRVDGSLEGPEQVGRRRLRRNPPPRLFREVAQRLGYRPPNTPARPPILPTGKCEPTPAIWYPDLTDYEQAGRGDRFSTTEGPRPSPREHERSGDERVLDERERGRRQEPGPSHDFTPDAVAYYHPWHIGGDDHWGIYFRRDHMERYIERIESLFGWSDMRAVVEEQVYWHEMEHFEQEKAATALEDLLDMPVYPTWMAQRFGISVQLKDRANGMPQTVHLIEEALATAREIEWAEDPKRGLPPGYAEFITWDARSRPVGYRSFHLCAGDSAKQEARAAFLESVGSVANSPPRRRLAGETAKRLFGIRTGTFEQVPFTWVDH